jgi:hypothetical protein
MFKNFPKNFRHLPLLSARKVTEYINSIINHGYHVNSINT